MKPTKKEIKDLLTGALEQYGYYDSAWEDLGDFEHRINSSYHEGQILILEKFYSIDNFSETPEGKAAFQKGVDRYNEQADYLESIEEEIEY
jgi:hypothetical protein